MTSNTSAGPGESPRRRRAWVAGSLFGGAVMAAALIAVMTGRGTAQAAITAHVSPGREYPPHWVQPPWKLHARKAVTTRTPSGSTSGSASAIAPVSVQKIYLEVDHIDGEVTTADPGISNAIAIQAFTWGANALRTSTTAGSASKATFSELSVVGYEDKSGPGLEKALALGTTIPTVTLTEVGTVNGNTRILHQIKLENAGVTSFQLENGGGDANLFFANFAYTKETTTYYQYDSTGSQIGSPQSFCWNIAGSC